ncbi:MAG: right-handed parallel beta-helix repeat-containing protein, partial [Methanobacterium sp.]|nr:right-handed parallel beta-helix repeat-containing protein [Methanobacterium sp.]
MTGNLEAQSFFPPGKVADYFGFQYLRDNDPDNMGHNTSFLTRIAYNIIYILNDTQLNQLKTLAITQQEQIDLYAYKRYPLMEVFRRLLEGDIPDNSTGLDLDAVKLASRELYILDGQISFDRALTYSIIIKSLNSTQKAYIDSMVGQGFNSWPDITSEQIKSKMQGLPQGTSVSVMTYASDLFSWYAGSVEADVYFCPERQGTYYGSFYIKDAPAIGHEGYIIDEQLTATAGSALCNSSLGYVTEEQALIISSLVDIQRNNLYAGSVNIVQVRTQIATLLRSLMISTDSSDSIKTQVLELSSIYGDLDGENNYYYATVFAQVYQSLSDNQKVALSNLRKSIMSGTYSDGTPYDFSVCTTPYLYSNPITDTSILDPYINDTDYLFYYPINVYPGGSIQNAIEIAETGDIIMVHGDNGSPWTYYENLIIDRLINIQSAGDGEVSIQAIDSNQPVITINNNGNSSIIKGFNIIGAENSFGIYLTNINNLQIIENTISNNFIGIFLQNSNNNQILKNTIQNNIWVGICLDNASSNIINNGNEINNNVDGIYLVNSSNNNTISRNTIHNNTNTGINLLNGSIGNIISLNTAISYNGLIGVLIRDSDSNTISSNTISNNIWAGLALDNADSNTINGGNTISGNQEGINLTNSTGNTISGNTITGNTNIGVSLISGSNGNFININNNISNNGIIGIYLRDSGNNTISSNNIQINTWLGVCFDNSTENTINNSNNISGNLEGLYIVNNSKNNIISSNSINDNQDTGIYIESSSGNQITNNTSISNNGVIGILLRY